MTSNDSRFMSDATRRGVLLGGGALAATAMGGEALAQTMEIVDIHAHIRSDDLTRYPPLPAVTARGVGGRGTTVEQMLAEMDAAGISKAAVVQLSSFYGPDNSYLADSMAKSKRLTGVCSIDILAPDAPQVLAGWLKRGITGLRVYTGGTGESNSALLDDPKGFPVWEYCEAHKAPICAQTTPDGLPKLVAMLKRFPKAVVILDHGARPKLDAGPPFAEAQSLFDLAAYPNLSVKVTPPLNAQTRMGKSTPQAFYAALNKAFGARRIAFGSNLPMTEGPMTKIVEDMKACLAELSPADQAMIFAGTAKRLYPALA